MYWCGLAVKRRPGDQEIGGSNPTAAMQGKMDIGKLDCESLPAKNVPQGSSGQQWKNSKA